MSYFGLALFAESGEERLDRFAAVGVGKAGESRFLGVDVAIGDNETTPVSRSGDTLRSTWAIDERVGDNEARRGGVPGEA